MRHRGSWRSAEFEFVCDSKCPLCQRIRAEAKAEGAAEEREAWSRVTGQPDADALSSYLGRLTLPEADAMHGRAMEERARSEREACIRDVCGRCRDGQPVELFAGWWAHRILNSKEHPFECAAHSIRARGAKEKP